MASIGNVRLEVEPIQNNKQHRNAKLFLRFAIKLFLCVVAVVLSSVGSVYAQPSFENANDFVGTWRNIDNQTRSIKRINITPQNGISPLIIRVYAKCSQSECDWGNVNGYNGPSGSHTVGAIVPSKNKAGYVFAQRDLTLRLNDNGQMDYDMETDYVSPWDPRPNRVDRGTLNRS